MKYLTEEAFRTAILTEKKSYDLYRKLADVVHESRLRMFFHELAEEEAEHMKSFVIRYPGDEFDLLAIVESKSALDTPEYRSFFAAAHGCLEGGKALEICLCEALSCINYYTSAVTCINEPGMRALFEYVLNDSRKQFEQIYEEYARISGKQSQKWQTAPRLPERRTSRAVANPVQH